MQTDYMPFISCNALKYACWKLGVCVCVLLFFSFLLPALLICRCSGYLPFLHRSFIVQLLCGCFPFPPHLFPISLWWGLSNTFRMMQVGHCVASVDGSLSEICKVPALCSTCDASKQSVLKGSVVGENGPHCSGNKKMSSQSLGGNWRKGSGWTGGPGKDGSNWKRGMMEKRKLLVWIFAARYQHWPSLLLSVFCK